MGSKHTSKWPTRYAWLASCIALLGAATRLTALPATEVAPPAPPAAAPPSTYVGGDACKSCHALVHGKWGDSAHGKALSSGRLPADMSSCESCHGPASEHVKSPANNRPVTPSASNAKLTNAVCGACHFKSATSRAPEAWQTIGASTYTRSAHGQKGLACVSCHTGHPNGNDKQLIKPAAELCASCHANVLERAPGKKADYTHSPVAEGQCLDCHDPHGTPSRDMVVTDIHKVCLQCHDVQDADLVTAHKGYPVEGTKCAQCHDAHSHDKEGGLLKKRQHALFKQDKCDACHNKPVAGQPVTLVKPAKELCITCHPTSALSRSGDTHHAPAKEGMCLTCHSPHASKEKGLLKGRVSNVCFSCHAKMEDSTTAEHRHQVFDTNMNCTTCHKPHSSPEEKLLTQPENALCGQCHKHSFSHPIGKRPDGTIVLNPRTAKAMVCSSCHEIHGSKFEALTVAEKGKDLCVMCHSQVDH